MFIEAEGGIDMNENLIHNLKHVKECLVNKEMVGEDWEERQEVLAKLEDVVTVSYTHLTLPTIA